MSEYLPKEVRDGLEAAHKLAQRRASRMRVRVGDQSFMVLRHWPGGFAVDAAEAPRLRGLVDLYDGARHLSHCLIVASEDIGSERIFEFKRATPAADRPALDYSRDETAPVALITATPG